MNKTWRRRDSRLNQATHTAPDVPREDLRELVRTGLDGIITATDPMQAALADIAPDVIARLRERWMDEFTRTMCAELAARRDPRSRVADETAHMVASSAAAKMYAATYERVYERALAELD